MESQAHYANDNLGTASVAPKTKKTVRTTRGLTTYLKGNDANSTVCATTEESKGLSYLNSRRDLTEVRSGHLHLRRWRN